MVSLLDRLFPPPVKAETGSGLYALQGFPMLNSLSNRPEKLIAEAEALFHTNVWVAACERAIVSRFASVEYHLEDENDETIDSDTSPLAASLIEVLNRPSPRRTRRQLWSITARHMGLTGNAFWYLSQRELMGGTPLECLYINPARMTPAEDSDGGLLGWIMDHPQNPMTPRDVTPTPFELNEIIHFVLDEPDWGNYGVGIAETTQTKIELSRLTDRHASMVIASGGRLAGIISPKAGATISDDGWQAIIRDYRNIVSDPDSAKRLQLIRSAVDFTKTTADPTELQLVDLSTMSRDDILAAWSVPLSQLGIVSARGLNSGDIPKFEEAQLWQGPIDARMAPFVEKIQSELIDRWAELGLKAHIEVETPEFDDQAPMFVNAEKAVWVPQTNDERRALVGDDPFEDGDLGAQVYVHKDLVRIDAGAPEPTPTPAPLPAVAMNQLAEQDAVGNAPMKASALETLRRRIELTWEPRIRKVISAVLSVQREELADRIEAKHSHLIRRPTDTAVWWNTEHERRRFTEALEPVVLSMAREVANRAAERFPTKALDAGYHDALTTYIRTRVGERITQISETTRDDIARLVESGITSGLSPTELAGTIREATAFNDSRAEMISRTETMNAYNEAALRTYNELGAERVQAIDGDQDEACAERNGREFSVDEAYSITDHPNGTLDWIPIVPAKGVERPVPAYWAGLEAIAKAAQIPPEPTPAPIVNVAASPAPIVNVNTESFAKALDGLTAILSAPKPRPVLDRDDNGRIVGIRYE